MKVKYYTKELRVLIKYKPNAYYPIRCVFQKRRKWWVLYFWENIDLLDLSNKGYWSITRGSNNDPFKGQPLRLSYAMFGGSETWQPEDFNLDKILDSHLERLSREIAHSEYCETLIKRYE